jgi:uncharacterized protein YbjT (DUF2867 family)
VNPVALSDVVAAIIAADAREAEVRGIWELGGPEVISMDEAAARAMPGARRVRATRSAPKALLQLYGSDMVADPSAAVAQFGLALQRAG